MSDPSRQDYPGIPRLSHADAEALISARADAPLPNEQNRILQAHLATCPSCRAFAEQVQFTTRALRDLPMLPASPTVSRQVRERIAVQPSVWSRLARWMFAGPWGAVPAAATALVLVAAATFFVILRGDGLDNGRANQIDAPDMTRTAMIATGTATTYAPTRIATQSIEPSPTPRVSTQEAEEPLFPDIQVSLTPTPTATATPSATPEPTETATPEPTETSTPEPSATATPEPSETSTAEPSATASPEPTDTETPEPSQTPEPSETSEPTATRTRTPEPTETATNEPTATRTPTLEPTETETPEPTETTTPEPTETNTPEPTETETPEPTETNTPRPSRTPTETATPEPTETPTEEPFVQPTISSRGDATTESIGSGGDEPTEEPEATEEPPDGGEDADNTRIVEADATETPEDVEEPTEEAESPTPDDVEINLSGPLAEAETLGDLGSDVGAPAGGLAMPVDAAAMVVTGADGGLIVVDQNGNTLMALGAAANPIWSPRGEVLLYTDLNGGNPAVAMWDRTENQLYPAGAGAEGSVSDLPAGWIGSQIYYLRSFLDEPGRVELHRAEYNGANDETLWTTEGVELAADRPVATLDGVLIPTNSNWIFVDTAGNESDYGENPFGYIGEGKLSPFGSLIAYPVNGELIIAPVSNPGTPQARIPYDGVSGFDYSADGEQIVVSDGGTLSIFWTSDGSFAGSANDQPGAFVVAPHWDESGIRFLEITDSTRLKLVSPDVFQQ